MTMTLLSRINDTYLSLHRTKEELFWETKMGLAADPAGSQVRLNDAEIALQQFIQSSQTLLELRERANDPSLTPSERIMLDGWIRFFSAHVIEGEEAKRCAAKLVALEGDLQSARASMELGYGLNGQLVRVTSTVLSNMLRVEQDESLRRAAFEGLASIERFVLEHGFLEVVGARNELAHLLGYEDYYDMKVQKTEGITKRELFELLDDLERRTRTHAEAAVEELVKQRGRDARAPWNFQYYRSGDLVRELDPYFPFSRSLDRWVRSFAGMGITFRDATLTLDLVDRKGKYENGFMHGPVPCYFDNGRWNPAVINFTANAIPSAVGAGFRALQTLFHEGGHAAHFSNVTMNAPCFSQEFAPTSVAYAETQSMLLDSLLSDADWQTRYALTEEGVPVPFGLIEQAIRKEQPFRAHMIRSMLTVCYAEKALYEMKPHERSPESVIDHLRQIERNLLYLDASPRPTLAVPHLLAGESSAYYHGYVLAEMAVYQTRSYLFGRYGHITDNPEVGEELSAGYWEPGNSVGFFDLVKRVTGTPFSADALVERATRDVDDALAEAQRLATLGAAKRAFEGTPKLNAKVRVVHGSELIAEFDDRGFDEADQRFRKWIRTQ